MSGKLHRITKEDAIPSFIVFTNQTPSTSAVSHAGVTLMKPKHNILIIFLALLVFSTIPFISPMAGIIPPSNESDSTDEGIIGSIPSYTQAPSTPPLPEGPSWDGNEFYYAGLGQVLNTKEYSHGQTATLSVSDLDYGESDSGQIVIPQGWTGYQLQASVYNLFDNVSHIYGSTRNGNFQSGTTSPNNWVESQRGMSGYGLDALEWNYGYYYGETGKGVNVQANCSDYDWISNATYIEYIGWTQTIDLNRIDVTSATMSFDVQFYDDGIHGRDDDDEMAVYAEIGGAERIFVCHRYALNAYRGGWGFHNIKFSLSVDELQAWTTDTIDVTIGMTVDFDWTINNYFSMDFDNVQLIVRGKAYPNDLGVQLQLNNTDTWSDLDYGMGNISLTGTWGPYASNDYIQVIWTTDSGGSRNVDFDYTLILYIKRSSTTESQTGPEGSAFIVKHGESVYWTVWFFAPFYSTYYSNYNFTLEKPTSETWTLDKAIDPNLQDQTTMVNGASNSTHIILPPSVVTGFGWWNFTFTSANSISSVTGVQSTYYISPRSPSQLSITVSLLKTVGEVNLTLYDPDGGVVSESSKSAAASVPFMINFDNGNTYPAGRYTLCLSYDNDATHDGTASATAAGFYSAEFDIVHDTTLTYETSPLLVTYGAGYFYPRVFYADSDRSDAFIGNTSGTVVVNGTVDGNEITFYQAGSWYEAKVSNALLAPGDFTLDIDANADYYEPASTMITLNVRSDASLTSPQSPGLTRPYDEIFTIQVYYADELNAGISSATITTDWPTTPTGTGNGTAGWYNIQIDTGDQPSPGTYSLTITAQRNYYTTRQLVLTIVVREISTTIDYIPPGSIPWDEDVNVTFDFSVNDPDSTNHDGDPITSSSFSFQLDGSPITQGPDYTLSNLGGGQYRITLLASSGKISTIKGYTLEIQADPTDSMFSDASRNVPFNVRALSTIILYEPPVPEPWGGDVVITINYTVDDPASTTHDGDPINDLLSGDVDCWLDGSPLGSFGWTALGSGQYNLTIYSSDISTVKVYSLLVTFTHSDPEYQSASRTISFQVIAHQTQTLVNQPDPTPYGQSTSVTVQWIDLVTDGALSDAQLSDIDVRFTNGTYVSTESSLSFTLDTSSWVPKTYNLTLTINPSSGQYRSSSGTLRITILIHQTAVNVLPPGETPLEMDTQLTIEWYDLTAGGTVDISNVQRIVVSGYGPDQEFTTFPTGYTITVDTDSWSRGSYALTVTIYAKIAPTRIFSDSSGPVTVVIRRHQVNVIANPPSPVPLGGSFTLSIEWYDVDLGIPIPIGELNYIRVVGNDTSYPNLPNNFGVFDIIISTAGWSQKVHLLNATVYPNNTDKYEILWDTALVFIRKRNIVVDVQPIPNIPYQNNTLIRLFVNDSDNDQRLNQQILSIRIQVTGYPDTVYDDSNWDNAWNVSIGEYLIPLASSSWSLGLHDIRITVTPVQVFKETFTDTKATIRPLSTDFTRDPLNLIPWNEDGNVTFHYFVEDAESAFDGTNLNSATITIVELVPAQYQVFNLGSGTYVVEFKSTALGDPGPMPPFTVQITQSAEYADGEISLTLTVRALQASLTYDQVVTAPFGDPIDIRVFYIIFDPESSNNNAPISGATITVTGLYGLTLTPGVDYTVTEFASYYRIRITKSLAIAGYFIRVDASHSTGRYTAKAIFDPPLPFSVRTVYSELDKPPVDAVPYADNFVVTIYYSVRDDMSSQDGNGIPGADDIQVLTNGSWTLNPGDYSIAEGAAGYYYITIDSDFTPYPGRWWIQIDVQWLAAPPPYEEQTVTAWLISTERPTRITNTNPPDTGFADLIEVYLNYTDIVSAWGIDNTTTGDYLRITILNHTTSLEITADYWVETYPGSGWDEPTLYYRFYINASQLGAVNVIFDFDILATWIGSNSPFYEQALKTFSVRTVGTETVLYAEAVQTQPTGDDIIILLHFNTTGGLPVTNSSGNVGIQVDCADIPSWDHSYWYVPASSWPGTDGNYTLIIVGSKNLAIDTYTFQVSLTWPTGFAPQFAPYYESADTLISARVRAIYTTMDWTQPTDVYYTQNLTILAQYQDIDHGYADITSTTWTISEPLAYSYSQFPNGTWLIEIDTSGLGAGAFSFYLTASKLNYLSQQRDIDIQIKFAPIILNPIDPPSFNIEEFWGVPIDIDVYLADGLTSNPMITGEIFFQFWTEPYKQMNYTGTPGYYTITLNTGPIGATATQLFIKANITNYETGLLIYTVSIKQIDTRLELPPGDLTALEPYVDTIMQLNVTFEGYNGTHWYPIENAWIKADDGTTFLDNFTMTITPGLYICQFDTSTWEIRTHTIIVQASSPNSVTRQITYTITILFKPCTITPEYTAYSGEYNENFTLRAYLGDDLLGNAPISGHTMYFIWQQVPYYLTSNGTPGWYIGSFIANETPSTLALEIKIYHDVFGKYSDTSTSISLTISERQTELELIRAYTLATINGIEYNVTISFTDSSWVIPIGETLVLTFWYRDITYNTLTDTHVRNAYFDFFGAQYFIYDSSTGYWTVQILLNNTEQGELEIAFTSINYIDQTITKTLQITYIETELTSDREILDILYVPTTYTFAIFLRDIYHNTGVTGANIIYDLTGTLHQGAQVSVAEDLLHSGYYNVTIVANTPSSGALSFIAIKENYQDSQIGYVFSLEYSILMNILITGGSFGAVFLVIALIGWILWARVYSIPWEVRRMRKLAKTVEKDEGYTLNRKDKKHFRAREVTMGDTVDKAMSTIGVAATPAMIPMTEEVEEVTATEEDIMGELDKIPGLGPEEKAVLADEMRKIPRKDRIWFLDDLRRQMGERRMDFLTQREPVKAEPTVKVKPEEKPKAKPKAKPKPKPKAKPKPEMEPEVPLDEVEAAEPPAPEKTLDEERTAPTVLPLEFQPPPVPAGVEAEIRRELDKIPGLDEDEKQALIDHLKYLSKEERRATYLSLRQSAEEE